MEALIILLVFILFAAALAGVFLPFLPGVPLAWFGLLIYALYTDFQSFSLTKLLVFLGLTLFTLIVDIVAPMLGAKRYKASAHGVIGSTVGLLFGTFALGPIGILLGPLIGAFLGELLAGKHQEAAMHSAMGVFVGFVAGSLIKLVIILTMLGFFVASLF